MKPQVSVIMPVYNGEKYLREAVQSVLDQTYTNFELIIIDDGSTDRTPAILKSFKDSRLRVFQGAHRGVAAARNKAVGLARGQYIAIQDADDISLPARLEKQLDFLERHTEIALVGSNYHVIDEVGKQLSHTNVFTHPDDLKLALVFFNDFGQGTIMLRASCLDKTPYDTKLPLAEDYDLWIRLSRRYRVANLPDYLYLWRLHHDSTWMSQQAKMKEHAYAMRDQQFEYLRSHRGSYKVWSFHPFSTLNVSGYMKRKGQVFRDMSLLLSYEGSWYPAFLAGCAATLFTPNNRCAWRQLFAILFNRRKIIEIPYDGI